MFFRCSVRLILECNGTSDRLTLSLSLAPRRVFLALNVTKTIASREIETMLSMECSLLNFFSLYQWHLFDIRLIYFRLFLTFSKMWKRTSMTSFDNCRWRCSSLLIDPSCLNGKLISIDRWQSSQTAEKWEKRPPDIRLATQPCDHRTDHDLPQHRHHWNHLIDAWCRDFVHSANASSLVTNNHFYIIDSF